MGFSSRSSKNKPYRNGHYGSSHYQRRGVFGKLMHVFGSNSSRDFHPHYPEPAPGPNGPRLPAPGVACLKCNHPIQAGSKFCPQCGTRAPETSFCAACGGQVPAGSKFCPQCGAGING